MTIQTEEQYQKAIEKLNILIDAPDADAPKMAALMHLGGIIDRYEDENLTPEQKTEVVWDRIQRLVNSIENDESIEKV